MRIFILFIISLLLFISACQEISTPAQPSEKTNIFFDLKGFFQEEKAVLEKRNSFKKIVSINGVSEEKDLSTLNLDNELSIFMASDINKPAWSDKYKIDSIYGADNQLAQIKYHSLDESLKTKKINIDFKNNNVSKVAIEKSTDNAVAQSKQYLTYTKDKGYVIQSEQTLSLSETKTIIVSVDFMN